MNGKTSVGRKNPSAEVKLKIPFHDVDPANIVWHGRYLKYFEQVRYELLERINFGYTEMAKSGFAWPVVELKIRYAKPILFDQTISVYAELVEWDYRLRINYEIKDDQRQVLTRATTEHVPMDMKTHEMQLGTPQIFLDRIEAILKKTNTDYQS